MAAGRQKKRLHASNVTRFNLHEKHRGKKKKLQSPDILWNMRPHVALEWDNCQKRAVARSEQIGITWRDVSPFLNPLLRLQSGLADVLSIPQEIFQLESMNDVLSYEVWETYLSESERKFLIQFLPSDKDAGEVVQSLLMGENLHFGNSFDKWSMSLVSGKLHPDAILCHAQHTRTNKKSYYSGLKKYHNEIIERLLNWKERWESCEDPEKEIVEKLWRKGKDSLSHGNSSKTSEAAKPVSLSVKEQASDTRYMSYLKISRRQHHLVKNIKHSGDGILSKSLNHVLGDVKYLKLQPYEKFEEEERKRLHEHWLHFICKDVPAAFEFFKDQRALKERWRESVVQDLSENHKMKIDSVEVNERLGCLSPEHTVCEDSEENLESVHEEVDDAVASQGDNGELEHHVERSALEKEDNELPQHEPEVDLQLVRDIYFVSHSNRHHLEKIPSLNSHQHEHSSEVLDQEGDQDTTESAADSSPMHQHLCHLSPASDVVECETDLATKANHLVRIPSPNIHQEPNPLSLYQQQNREILNTSHRSSPVSPTPGNFKDTIMKPEDSSFNAKDAWTVVNIQDSYREPTSHGGCTYHPVGDLSLKQPQRTYECSSAAINLGTDMIVDEASQSVPSTSGVANEALAFNSYANQPNILQRPFPKEQGLLSSLSHEQLNNLKRSDLPYLMQIDGLSQSPTSPHHFLEQRWLVEQRQTREKEPYVHETTNKTDSSNGRYRNQSHFPLVESQDWHAFSSPINGGYLRHNLFPVELRLNNSWSGIEPSGNLGQCLGNTRNADGSLYSVLHEYKNPSNFSSIAGSSEQLAYTSNYVPGGVASNGRFSNNNVYGFHPNQLTIASSNDSVGMAAPSKVMGNMTWMDFPQQNPSLGDLMGKSYLRSWQQ